MDKLAEYHKEFYNDVKVRASSGGDWMAAAFFEIFEEIASENGDIEALDYSHYRAPGLRIDGYHYDEVSRISTIAVTDFRDYETVEKLNASDINTSFKRAENFVLRSFEKDFTLNLEESSPGFQVAYSLLDLKETKKINRVKIILFSNAIFAARLKGIENKEIDNIVFSYNVLDFTRYYNIIHSRTGSEPIEIDLEELNAQPIPFLSATTNKSEYASYLLAISGNLLAQIYSTFGSRLLEQNVRTFLQARGKVNKGIQITLKDEPEMFFAYNNGLTATASNISVIKLSDGTLGINKFNNLQIVNGGQTTASLLYARDRDKIDLSNVFVQVKLSVINEDKIEKIVPNISRYANTQNKVNEADFFSNHPFHVRIEEFSRRLYAPAKDGIFNQTKWYYERARGQYKDETAYMTDAKRKEFTLQNPRYQMFTKTDLAKYHKSFECEPHMVSRGAQKNFIEFARTIATVWSQNDKKINEEWYKNKVSQAIIFKEVDKLVMSAKWYEGGYKANIVTYSIAWLMNYLKKEIKSELDLQKIWEIQTMGPSLTSAMDMICQKIATSITETPSNVRNVTEWCKNQACWASISEVKIVQLGSSDIQQFCQSKIEKRQQMQDAIKIQKIDNDLNMEIVITKIGKEWEEIRRFATGKALISGQEDQTISKVIREGFVKNSFEIRYLKSVIEKVNKNGFLIKALEK